MPFGHGQCIESLTRRAVPRSVATRRWPLCSHRFQMPDSRHTYMAAGFAAADEMPPSPVTVTSTIFMGFCQRLLRWPRAISRPCHSFTSLGSPDPEERLSRRLPTRPYVSEESTPTVLMRPEGRKFACPGSAANRTGLPDATVVGRTCAQWRLLNLIPNFRPIQYRLPSAGSAEFGLRHQKRWPRCRGHLVTKPYAKEVQKPESTSRCGVSRRTRRWRGYPLRWHTLQTPPSPLSRRRRRRWWDARQSTRNRWVILATA